MVDATDLIVDASRYSTKTISAGLKFLPKSGETSSQRELLMTVGFSSVALAAGWYMFPYLVAAATVDPTGQLFVATMAPFTKSMLMGACFQTGKLGVGKLNNRVVNKPTDEGSHSCRGCKSSKKCD